MPDLPPHHAPVGRLALRAEDEHWVAYYAPPDTMDNALWLGAVRLALVTDNPARKQGFIGLMSGIVMDIIEAATGHRPLMHPPEVAPEHERAPRGKPVRH